VNAIYSLPVTEEDGAVRLDRWLRRRFPHLSQGQVEKLIRTGQIRVDGARAKASDRLAAGQMIRIPPLPTSTPKGEESSRLSQKDEEFVRSLVIYRDDDLIAINKPHGLAVQGGTKTLRHLDGLLDGLRFDSEERPKLVHRLDRDTSGVMVIARHPAAAAALSAAFKSRDTDKIYWAVTIGVPHPQLGEIRSWIKKAGGPREGDQELMRPAAHREEGAVFAITDYVVLAEAARKAAWVALKPLTGRTHQLRFHMLEVETPILGDPKYKTAKEVPGGLAQALHLHARALRLPHPNGKKTFSIIAPLPPHMEETFEAFGFDARDAKDPFAAFEQKRGRGK
jgi:23S rRNA pseudouridine955/2504/2580 synthase